MGEPFKNTLFSDEIISEIASSFSSSYSKFDTAAFLSAVHDTKWPERELKDRLRHITKMAHKQLPEIFPDALPILYRANRHFKQGGFAAMVFSEYVALYGLDDWELSMYALETFTQTISAEFAIRPFLHKDFTITMKRMLAWSRHDHEGVRRLASEGCRPYLPWGLAIPALKRDPAHILVILENLKNDPSENVRRSVANNLNDISRDHPDKVIGTIKRWHKEDIGDFDKMASRALRTLIKKGNPQALELHGVKGKARVNIAYFDIRPDTISIGDSISINFDVLSTDGDDQTLVIDYIVHHVRADGSLSPKVFKLKKTVIPPKSKISITKKHSFAQVTTRRYYPGRHLIEIQINGTVFSGGEIIVNPE